MSILWGLLREKGGSVDKDELLASADPTRQYGTSEPAILTYGRIGMGLQLYTSHLRSRLDSRPFSDDRGNIVCFDGRLDNFIELLRTLSIDDPDTADSKIALAAFARWGEDCFSRLTGDWSLALWSEREQKLFLARDHAGTRSLYFARSDRQIQWATYLDTFTAAQTELNLSRAYASGYLTHSPVRDLTPYDGIRAVKPGHFVAFRDGQFVQKPHWSPLVRRSIHYKAEADYDECFRTVFGTAVARRTDCDGSTLAQLSGGMDSTSIVCMSDQMRRCLDPSAEILDTISFYDDSEASLDEKRYFLITERQRGKTGIHLEIRSSLRTFELSNKGGTYQAPGCDNFSLNLERSLYEAICERGYRSILSGIGGDEVLGGVPDGRPELADYLLGGRIGALLQRSIAWSLPDRTPLIQALWRTTRYALSLYLRNNPKRRSPPPWLSSSLRDFHAQLEHESDIVPHRIGAAPHRVENAVTWWHILETLPHLSPQLLFRPEYRYPMLDKDLVEFLFSIPPEQLVQPGRRRALMRRALRDIVPVEVLERRRKAFELRAPLAAIRSAQKRLEKLFSTSILAELGFIDPNECIRTLRAVTDGNAVGFHTILRAIAYELWLRARLGRSTDPDPRLVDLTLATP